MPKQSCAVKAIYIPLKSRYTRDIHKRLARRAESSLPFQDGTGFALFCDENVRTNFNTL
jgi:hypothetical protein